MAKYGIEVYSGDGTGVQIDSESTACGLYAAYTLQLVHNSKLPDPFNGLHDPFCATSRVIPFTDALVAYKGNIPVYYHRSSGQLFSPPEYDGQYITLYCFKKGAFRYPSGDYGAVSCNGQGYITWSTAHSPLLLRDVIASPAMRPSPAQVNTGPVNPGPLRYSIPPGCGVILDSRVCFVQGYWSQDHWSIVPGRFPIMTAVSNNTLTLSSFRFSWFYVNDVGYGWDNEQPLVLNIVDLSRY